MLTHGICSCQSHKKYVLPVCRHKKCLGVPRINAETDKFRRGPKDNAHISPFSLHQIRIVRSFSIDAEAIISLDGCV